MPKSFAQYDYDDAKELFNEVPQLAGLAGQTVANGLTPRRPQSAKSATDFFLGDHWQNTKGFIGQLPAVGYPGAAQIEADIKARFESENVVKEVVETHIGGLLGREPLWSFLKETPPKNLTGKKLNKAKKDLTDDATGESLTPWWNEREALNDLQKTAETILLEGIAVKRIFIPRGLVPTAIENDEEQSSVIPIQPDLNAALDFIHIQTLTADKAGVFTDPDTQKKVGVYLYEEKDDEGNVLANCAEMSFLDDNRDTVIRVVRDQSGTTDEFGPYRLGGRLLVFELQRPPLITEQVQTNQKAINLAHTMMTRNVNMAGSRERAYTNAQTPKKKRRTSAPDNPNVSIDVFEDAPATTGAGAVMFLMGYPIYNDQGKVTGYTNPGVHITDPASVEVFEKTRDVKYSAILGQCHQRHILIQGDATTSGVSRKQAEKEWQRSLKDTKTVVDAAGRWELETSLLMAAQLTGESDKYLNLRADFNCLLDVGDPTPEERASVMEMRKPGGPNNQPLISDETARNWIGIDDATAELERIEEEAPAEPITPLETDASIPPNQVDKSAEMVS